MLYIYLLCASFVLWMGCGKMGFAGKSFFVQSGRECGKESFVRQNKHKGKKYIKVIKIKNAICLCL